LNFATSSEDLFAIIVLRFVLPSDSVTLTYAVKPGKFEIQGTKEKCFEL
jgi:hypothetical protein